MNKLTAIGLTITLLAGGSALAAAPANAASASEVAKVKSLQEDLRIHKLKLSTDITKGSSTDIKLRAKFFAAKKSFDAGYLMECEARGYEKIANAVKVSDTRTAASMKMNKELFDITKNKFSVSNNKMKTALEDLKNVRKDMEKTSVFKHQYLTVDRVYKKYNTSNCDIDINRAAQAAKKTYSKAIPQSNIKKVNAVLDQTSKLAKSAVLSKTADRKQKENIKYYDNEAKQKIAKIEKSLKSFKK